MDAFWGCACLAEMDVYSVIHHDGKDYIKIDNKTWECIGGASSRVTEHINIEGGCHVEKRGRGRPKKQCIKRSFQALKA